MVLSSNLCDASHIKSLSKGNNRVKTLYLTVAKTLLFYSYFKDISYDVNSFQTKVYKAADKDLV